MLEQGQIKHINSPVIARNSGAGVASGTVQALGGSGTFAGLAMPALTEQGVAVRGFARDDKEADKARASGADVLALWAQQTARRGHVVHHLGLTFGGRPASSSARRLMVPACRDTLVQMVRQHGSPGFVPPAAVGIDGWCDRERRKTIALLPDREPAAVEAWLPEQPCRATLAFDALAGHALDACQQRFIRTLGQRR